MSDEALIMDSDKDKNSNEQFGGVGEKQWIDKNRDAIEHYNARIERDGVFAARKRKF